MLKMVEPARTSPETTKALVRSPALIVVIDENEADLRMSDRLAERIQREAGTDSAVQVARAYQLAYGRAPTSDEVREAQQVVEIGRCGFGSFGHTSIIYRARSYRKRLTFGSAARYIASHLIAHNLLENEHVG